MGRTKDAKKFLDRHKRLDSALDAYFNNPNAPPSPSSQQPTSAPSTSKLNALFLKYKGKICASEGESKTSFYLLFNSDPESDEITVDGTIKLCEDLMVDPEEVVLLAVAFELKSKRLGQWNKQGWAEGWKSLGCVLYRFSSLKMRTPYQLVATTYQR